MNNRKIQQKVDITVANYCSNMSSGDELVSVIMYVDDKCKDYIRSKLQECNCLIKYELDIIGAFAIDLCAHEINNIAQDEKVIYITKDIEAQTCLNVARPAAGIADNTAYSGQGIGVAVIDTGIFPHEDLNGHIVEFVDFVQGKKSPYDDNGHGTHCAGIIAASGASSQGKYKGIAPGVNLIGLKVMDKNGGGSASNILAALDWVYKNKNKYNIKVASLSLGARPDGHRNFDPLVKAVEKLWDSGVVVVVAAGNEGPGSSTIGTPGISKKIITVGCSDDKKTVTLTDDVIAKFSSRGPSPFTKNKPDLAAPGVDIVSLANRSKSYIAMSGTSMSTPLVSGCCALLLEKYPNLSPDSIKQKLSRSAYPLNESKFAQGSGVVSLNKLL